MKINYICHERLPSPHTNAEQIIKSATALVKQGVQVRLVCPGRKEDKNIGKDRWEEIASFYGIAPDIFQKGLELIELPVPFLITGKAVRLFHDIKAAGYTRNLDQDLVYTRDLISLMTALASGVKVLFETYRSDINARARFRWWRSFCYPHPNLLGIVTHSQMVRAAFIRAGIPSDKVEVAYNGGLTAADGLIISREEARRRVGLPEKCKIVIYTGHVNRKKGLEVIIPMAGLLPDVRFVLVGGIPGSSFMKRFKQRIVAGKISNISIIPRVPPSQVDLYLCAADCLILPPSARPLRGGRTVIPMKTFQYLGAGRPILAPDTADVREVLKHKHNAILVPPDSPSDAAQAIRDLLDDKEWQDHLSRNAKSDADLYTWRKRAETIAAFLSRVLKS